MVIMLMIFVMFDEIVPIRKNGCGILGQNYVALFQEMKCLQGCIRGI